MSLCRAVIYTWRAGRHCRSQPFVAQCMCNMPLTFSIRDFEISTLVSCRGYVLSRDVVHNLVHTIAGFSLQPETQPGEHDLVDRITTTHKTFQMRRHRHAAGT